MHRHQPSYTAAFHRLPIELNKIIAHYLITDKDICNFRLICRNTHDAVEGDFLSFWRAKYRDKYAFRDDRVKTNHVLKLEYQTRAKYLKRGVTGDFSSQARGKAEVMVIRVLRDLILESYQGKHKFDNYDRPRCPNQEAIIQFMLNSKSFLSIKPLPRSSPKLDSNTKLLAVQIMCAQLLFHVDGLKYDIFSFDDSQKAVYSSMRTTPIFEGSGNLQVNMNWTLHCLNFFRHHMIKEEARSLYETMSEMEAGEKPSAWRTPLTNGCYPLSRCWRGTYSYLEPRELDKLRKIAACKKGRYTDDFIFEDKNIELGGNIQELRLDSVEADKLAWPKLFEDRLQSKRQTLTGPTTRAQHRAPKYSEDDPVSVQLTGEGVDQNDSFYASGWLNPLAPQGGIPGWQRITLMKHFDVDLEQAHLDDLWAYEGVVLPGGRLIFGRWWYANGEPNSANYGNNCGPFILWAVDELPDFNINDDN